MTSPRYPTTGPDSETTWEQYFAELHRSSLELKAAKLDAKESAEDNDNVVVLEQSVEIADLATLSVSKASSLAPGTLALAAVDKGWEVRAATNVSFEEGRTTSTGRKYADKTNQNFWIEGRIPGKPFAFRARWVKNSFHEASCWGIEDAAFIWPKGTIERAVKFFSGSEDAELFAHFVHFRGLFMNVEQIKDLNDKRETAKVMKRIAKQEKARAAKGGVDVIAGD